MQYYFLTPITVEGSAPPPAANDPGWGSPCGGKTGKGGGDIKNKAVAAIVVAIAGAYSSKGLISFSTVSSISIRS